MQTKHTPAPWAHQVISEGFKIVADLDFTVGIVDCGTIEKMEANAKLIAAAPKMIKQLCDTYQYLLHLNNENWRGRVFREGQHQLVSLRDLIAVSLGLSSREVQEYFEENKATL